MLDDFTLNVSYLAGFLIVLPLLVSQYLRLTGDLVIDAIPTVGFSDPILSYLSAVRFASDGARVLNEGYKKAKPGLFKIATFRRWMVLAAEPDLIDDIKGAPDDVLSRFENFDDLLQPEFTMDIPNALNAHSSDVMRYRLGRDIASTFKETREELMMAMDDFVPTKGDKWLKVDVQDTFQRVICRISNRTLVGAPLCRDNDYQILNITFIINIVTSGFIIGLFPRPLKRFVSRMRSNLHAQIRQEIEFIRPIFDERFAQLEEYGEDWDDKPSDLLTWFMSEVPKEERTVGNMARRLLLTNLAAIRLTSSVFTQMLYRLLSNPEYLEPLRQEIEAVIGEEGWTKAGLDKMYKVDSFLRETQRVDSVLSVVSTRLVSRPFAFSNGVTLPAGTIVAVPSRAIQNDGGIYPNPDEFDGFRFAGVCESEADGTTTSKYRAISTSDEYMPFGVGRHACPGRFYVVNELKALFAYVVTTYDIKFEEGHGAPRDICVAEVRTPGNANVMFRERRK